MSNSKGALLAFVDDIMQEPELLQYVWDVADVRNWLQMTAEDTEEPLDWAAYYLKATPREREHLVWDITKIVRMKQLAESKTTLLVARTVHAYWEDLPAAAPRSDRPVIRNNYERCYLCSGRFRKGEEYRAVYYASFSALHQYHKPPASTLKLDNAKDSAEALTIFLCYRCLHTTPRRER